MATKAKSKSTQAKKTKTPTSIVWFEIPADDLSRAKKFYNGLLGWKINAFPAMKDYWHIDTGGSDDSPDGGLMKRVCPEHQGITTYVNVESVDKFAAKVVKLGRQNLQAEDCRPGDGVFC